jgi:hypothetical protein
MIISHKYKFIFLKTRKTAGTSIEIALSKFCGPDDIITPISRDDEKLRNSLGYPGSQNCRVPPDRYSAADMQKKQMTGKALRFYNHVPACDVRRWIGPDIWDSYFKFCFERNPWDKAISRYYFDMAKFDLEISFAEYIAGVEKKLISSYDIYTINHQVAVDFVGRYERLDKDIEWISKKLKLPEKLDLPYAKSGYRKDNRSYTQVIEQPERDIIADICSKEITLFGYTF